MSSKVSLFSCLKIQHRYANFGLPILLTLFSCMTPHLVFAAKSDLCSRLLSMESGQLVFSGEYNAQSPKQQLFEEVISPSKANGNLIIQYLAQHPLLSDLGLQKLYDGSAGVSEGFSLKAHTLMVINVLKEQLPFHKVKEIESDLDLEKLFLFMIAVHDVGKSLSVAEWSANNEGRVPEQFRELYEASKRQHVFTVPIVLQIMEQLGFSEREQKLVVALIDNDIVGQVARYSPNAERPKGISPEDGFELLAKKAAESGLTFKDYFVLKSLFFIVDAASYPALRYGRGSGERARAPVFMENDQGRLIPTSSYFHDLTDLFDRDVNFIETYGK